MLLSVVITNTKDSTTPVGAATPNVCFISVIGTRTYVRHRVERHLRLQGSKVQKFEVRITQLQMVQSVIFL